jgi:hypothetical protein
MPRRRRVLSIALLLALLGAGEGYRLAHRDGPSPVLQTIVLPGRQPSLFYLDVDGGRFYFKTNQTNPLNSINTQSGHLTSLSGALGSTVGVPIVDHQSGHYFDLDQFGNNFVMIDMRTGATLKVIPFPFPTSSNNQSWSPDTVRDRVLVVFHHVPDMLVIDGRTGRVLHDLNGCLTQEWPVVDQQTDRIFELCTDGSVLVWENRAYRRLGFVQGPHIDPCVWCSLRVDQATQRVFVPANTGLSVLDARTGALVRALPIQSLAAGSVAILPGSHDVVAAPYQDPSSGPPARSVVVLDGKTGAVLGRWPVPENPVQVLLNPLTGHLLVASAGPVDGGADPLGFGTLSVLDARTGAILRQVQTGIFPGAIAADSRTRHLFVVNFNTAMDDMLFPLTRHYQDGRWPQLVRWLKGLAPWLPFTAPQQPTPQGTGTVTMMDLAKL